MTDIYAEFGVNNAVIAGSTPEEHEEAMLALDVSARDGDDSITLDTQEEEEQAEESAEEEQAEEVEDSEEEADDEQADEASEESELKAVGDIPEELEATLKDMDANLNGLEELKAAAAERGLTPEVMAAIESEYEAGGISKASYEALAEAGYSKGFVDSYLRGQEAMAERYAASVIQMAGGQENFDNLVKHLEVNAGGSESLMNAIQNRDIGTVKMIINLAAGSRVKTFGKPAARTVTAKAKQAAPVSKAAVGFTSKAEMINAMSDKRYATDAKYRSVVEQKVAHSTF